MNLHAIELRRVCLPLVSPFRTSLGTESVREALLVRVESDAGEGWGECAAGSDPRYCSEYVEAAWLTLSRYLGPRLLCMPELTATDVRPLLRAFRGHRMAKAALEMAVLDAQLRVAGVSFGTFLGGVADAVAPGVAVGIMGSVGQTARLGGRVSRRRVPAGQAQDPTGLGPGPLQAVRERFGAT